MSQINKGEIGKALADFVSMLRAMVDEVVLIVFSLAFRFAVILLRSSSRRLRHA